MHEEARNFIAKQAAKYGPFDAVLEIGSRDINGSVRQYFIPARYLGIDLFLGDGVDVVADAANGWQPPEHYDAIVCAEVFEHTARWSAIIRNIAHWLKPSGVGILTMASIGREPHSGIDGGTPHPGEYYANITPEALRAACFQEGLVCEIETSNPGDLYAVTRKT